MKRSILMLAAALLLNGADSARAQVISSGPFNVGINLSSGGALYDSTSGVGFQRASDGYDPLAPGSPRDSWGVSANGVAGFSDPFDYGVSNLVSNGSTIGAKNASSSNFLNAGAGNLLQVNQSYSFLQSNVLQISTTITNVSGVAQAVLFQRDVDWDVAPTPFYEITTGPKLPAAGAVSGASFYGFENPDPTVAYGTPIPSGGGTDGPGDLGGGISLNLGTLAAGASTTFNYFYAINTVGQTPTGLAAELTGDGASYVVTTYSSDGDFTSATNSAAIAYGLPVVSSGATPEPASLTMLGIGALSLIGYARRRQKKLAV